MDDIHPQDREAGDGQRQNGAMDRAKDGGGNAQASQLIVRFIDSFRVMSGEQQKYKNATMLQKILIFFTGT